MGTKAPMMASAESARAPKSERVTIEAHFLHSGRLRGSFGSGVGIGTQRIVVPSNSCVVPTTWEPVSMVVGMFFANKTSSILSRSRTFTPIGAEMFLIVFAILAVSTGDDYACVYGDGWTELSVRTLKRKTKVTLKKTRSALTIINGLQYLLHMNVIHMQGPVSSVTLLGY